MYEKAFEINFDGIPGLTHNYSGLSTGNIASTSNSEQMSNPREAALQGLEKMKHLSDLGLKQGVLPPQERPDIHTLHLLGFRGSDAEILAQAKKSAPKILAAVSSASSMWTANACTVSPSADSADGKVHFTPANLANKFHRSIEPETTGRILQSIFKDKDKFVHHPALPSNLHFGDEGAANHTRLCTEYHQPGLQLFVFGRYAFQSGMQEPHYFPARQTLEASTSIGRAHLLNPDHVLYIQQHPEAIDKGIFHNDVISVGNQNVFFYHEGAFLNQEEVITEISNKFTAINGKDLQFVRVKSSQLNLDDVVKSYLFNSQLVTLPNGEMKLIIPSDCYAVPAVKKYLEDLLSDNATPIQSVHAFDLKQSMRNGGGPACLRLRVVLTESEIQKCNSKIFLTDSLYHELKTWVKKHYRDRLSGDDLSDPKLLVECRTALDELTQILDLPSIYPFQR